MGLTNITLQNAAPREKAYKLYDQGGLYVIVTKGGSKLWRMDYRFGGKRKTLSLGQWPKVTIAAARIQRDKFRSEIDQARDPGVVDVQADTFEKLIRDWFKAKADAWVSSYSTRIMSRLEDDIFPILGSRPPSDIEPPELLAAIRRIEDRGAIELAKRVKNYCGEAFRFGIAEGRCTRDPSLDIRGALKPKPRTIHRAALRFAQVPEFVARLDAFTHDTLAVQALKLTMLTVLRTHEIRFARWDEIEGDLWKIPAERMKERLPHIVVLSRQAKALLAEIPRRGPLLFAADTKSGVISDNAMLNVIFRMGYKSSMTVHGLRRTFSTHANESALWREDPIELCLAHVTGSDVRRAYNAALYLPERAQIMQWWADLLWPADEFADLLG